MRTLIRAAIAFALVISSIVGPVSAATTGSVTIAQANQGTLSGKITDDRGNALSGAQVEANGPTRATATTAGDGTFSLSLPPGVYSVTVAKGGFTGAQNDGVTVVAGTPLRLAITLTESNLQSTRVIGRTNSVGTGNNRAPFNISESATATLLPGAIAQRQNNNLTDLVAELPGVTVSRGFSVTPNTSFSVHGLPFQTRTTIDGHSVSSAIAGQWNTNYALSSMFEDVEVTKGAGLNGALAGESAVGTVNLRTRNFTANNSAGLTVGSDTYKGGLYNVYADVNLLKDNRLSLIVQKAYSGYNGPSAGYYGDRLNTGNISATPIGTGMIPAFTGLDQWTGDFSNRYSLEGELVKARYKFSEATSFTASYLGLQGQYQPQGGSYGSYYGKMTLQACQLTAGGAFSADPAGCTAASTFSPPYTFGNAGNTVDAYSWFPNSFIQNNEPQFSAELRTSFRGDTILLRPYTHLINRYISGVHENEYPGNGGGWFAVTNIANCQVQFLRPGTTGGPATGAAGPCFGAGLSPNSPSYIGGATQTPVFQTTTVAPNGGTCSPTPPFTCFTTTTGIENDGKYGYGTPFSQPEIDRLSGYTFTYLHPMGDSSINFTYDYRMDATASASSDQSGAAPGCSFVIGGVTGALANTIQPGCSTAQTTAGPYLSYNLLPRSSIGTPLTVAQFYDFSLGGLFQVNPQLRLALGGYYEIYKVGPQSERPSTLTTYAALGSANAAPVDLITTPTSFSHFDPHVGLEYRIDPTLSVRANFGSSITQPYASILSGFGSITVPNAANNQTYTISIPNAALKPETTVTYNFGLDKRLGDGTVLSMDAYHINTHNVFISATQAITPPAPYTAFPGVQTNTINAGQQISYGVEASLLRNPAVGFGYYLTGSLNRSFYANIPLSFYAFNTTPGNASFILNNEQIFGNPFAKGYGSLFFNGIRGMNANIGVEYNGQDNPTYSKPYFLWDASLKVPIVGNRLMLQMAVQNAFNYNNNVGIARGLVNQGNVEPAVYLSNGALVYAPANTRTQTSIFQVPPRDFRLSAILRL